MDEPEHDSDRSDTAAGAAHSEDLVPGGLVDRISSAFPRPDAVDVDRLRRALATRAEAERLLDLAYRVVDSPIGGLLVVASPSGVVRVAFELEDHDTVLAELSDSISPRVLESGIGTDDAARELEEYFAGRRQTFDVPVDLRLVRGFRRITLDALRAVPYGTTVSYADLAARAGNPRAVRAAAGACSHNPVPLIVPCHRVVRSDGTVGNYLGGRQVKVDLLALEATEGP